MHAHFLCLLALLERIYSLTLNYVTIRSCWIGRWNRTRGDFPPPLLSFSSFSAWPSAWTLTCDISYDITNGRRKGEVRVGCKRDRDQKMRELKRTKRERESVMERRLFVLIFKIWRGSASCASNVEVNFDFSYFPYNFFLYSLHRCPLDRLLWKTLWGVSIWTPPPTLSSHLSALHFSEW